MAAATVAIFALLVSSAVRAQGGNGNCKVSGAVTVLDPVYGG